VIITSILVMWRPLLFSSFDPEMAEASGVPLKILGLLFLVIVALTVSVAMQVVGVLLVFALLVGPSATAARIIHRPGLTVSLAILLGLVYTWLGILLAAKSNWPVSFYIAGISFLVYLPVRLFVHAGIRPKSNFPRSLLTHSDQEISENMVSANDDLAKLEDMDD
jgi:zinc/manganese transport system permease protein